jgi:pyruvate formate lyase activating enzyme
MHSPAAATGLIARVERGAVHDGPGLRTVVFLKGCPLRCLWCHSPETQSTEPEVLLLKERCIACELCIGTCVTGAAHAGPTVDRLRCLACGTCGQTCPSGARELCGHSVTVDELMADLVRDRSFYDQSGGGVTLSGGEPLLQPAFALALLDRCRHEHIHSAIETCGLVNQGVLLTAAAKTDLILFDVKSIDDRRHRALTMASNVRILGNLKALVAAKANVVVRYPLLPGLNDDRGAIAALGEFAAAEGIRHIDVLPYHRAGIAKYERLDRAYSLEQLEPPEPALVERTVTTLRGYGIEVTAGGVA